ncbi:ABC transporter ATP-binding protein [Burkholderia thailandensis]|uniref:ABC transporter, ATP-binding/permease protein, putative n=2 Tax=Burkholderia thailandensis TaxID=57975 RepID=Q2T480_BURTA|nr:ABC transporter ATP-binding protein [Burkholderia thailandensis]ABC34726.1 ABC transporter, ATP-binding/permease protein, putative [Burkholderia thailandensis E264]AHI77218.1 ABC transporter family protein [Burkholderia thailandensis 2002721723]AHI81722.1 ABC transporter family protein [Burkholderia thailandensis E444]AIC89341.1 ABC transporter family protein [Burkholderia thailandensis USAMRU Malaysia \
MNAPLSRMLRPFAAPLAAAVALQALAGVASLVPWLALGRIAEHWRIAADLDGAAREWLAAAVAAGVCWLSGQTIALHLTHRVDADLSDRLRKRLADHLQRLPLTWFARTGSDRIARYVDQDVRALHQLVAHAPADVTQLIVVPGAALACLLYLNPALLAFALAPLVLGAALFRRMRSARFVPAFADRNAALEKLMGDYAEFARNPALVRQYPGAGIEAVVLDSVARFERAFSAWVGRIGGLGACTQVLLGTPLLLAWVVLGAMGVALARSPIGELCVFALLIWAVAAPVRALGHGADALREARAAATRLDALLALPGLPQPPDGAQAPPAPRDASIAIRGVCVDFDGTRILHDIDATIGAGTTTAIVGPSGAGKSTLLTLLARFMDPDRGDVLLGGADLRALPQRVLRDQVAMVFQQAVALDVSIAENIALYRPDASRDEIRAAARAACLADRIDALPGGYDCVHGRDARFSGGELQRLAIARALLSHAPLLLLDEPASALDPQTGRALRNALHGGARTRVIVSHDLAAVRQADQILVMDRGRIVERGTHRALLDARGLYARLWAERDRPAEEATR